MSAKIKIEGSPAEGKAAEGQPAEGEGEGKGAPSGTPDPLTAAQARVAELEAAVAKREADDKAAAKIAAEAKKRAEGKTAELLAERDAELAAIREKLSGFEAKETARVEALAKANDKALKALPESVRKLAPKGADADTLSQWIADAADLAGVAQEKPAGGVIPRIVGNVEPHPDAVKYAAERKIDPVTAHNAMVKAGRLPKDTKLIPTA